MVGTEAAWEQAEIPGLFLEEWILPGLSIQVTLARIKGQGGLVYVPHPLPHELSPTIGLHHGFPDYVASSIDSSSTSHLGSADRALA
ncbi:MAG TPA: hypothetical protein VMW58_03040 [Anaerolineae bacterium]|nr:hypothetical protein [Anaerolineae bacterium]